MSSNRPLPISGIWESPDAYIQALLSFSTTSLLFLNLCGGVHMVDFLTRQPDMYTTLLPEEWRVFFEYHDVQDIIHLLLREDIHQLQRAGEHVVDPSGRTWKGGAFPPQSLLDYISNVRQLTLQRENCTLTLEKVDLPKQVAMRMNKRKFTRSNAFRDMLHPYQTLQPVSHIVDFGSGQNYLGRTLASSPYHKHVIAIERKHQYISGARDMDIRAKLAKDPKAVYTNYDKDLKSENDSKPAVEVTIPENTDSRQLTNDVSITKEAAVTQMLDEISLEPDELLGSLTKNPSRAKTVKPEIDHRGTLSYIEHEIQDGYLEPIIDHVINPPTDTTETSDEAEITRDDAQIMVVSLHSCGNLVHHGLRSLILNPSIVAVAMIGCCYNLLTERLGPATHNLPILESLHPRLDETGKSYDPHGFPMSKYYENYQSPGATTGMKLNITARALAVQAPYNWGPEDSEMSFTRHYFRALLERILVDRNVLAKPHVSDNTSEGSHSAQRSIIIGSVSKAAYKSFNSYLRAATVKMTRDPIYGARVQEHIATMTDEEINQYETRYFHAKKHISVMWSLMGFSAQLVEAIIVVDRWQFLREQDSVKECWVEPVFDYSASPRNLAVIGLKK
ncbi:hypothetical protein N7540_004352 [Penicillium herquei]|nr:hypothetical protein N7540_004352 [Penicillium herquei]